MTTKDVVVDFACQLVHISPGLILNCSLSLMTAVCKHNLPRSPCRLWVYVAPILIFEAADNFMNFFEPYALGRRSRPTVACSSSW